MKIFFLILFLVHLTLVANKNVDHDKYIKDLREDEKTKFIHRVARRILEEVKPKSIVENKTLAVSEESLNAQEKFVQKIIIEEKAKLENARRNASFQEEVKNFQDLTLRAQPRRNSDEISKENNLPEIKRQKRMDQNVPLTVQSHSANQIPVKTVYEPVEVILATTSKPEETVTVSDKNALRTTTEPMTTENSYLEDDNNSTSEYSDSDTENNQTSVLDFTTTEVPETEASVITAHNISVQNVETTNPIGEQTPTEQLEVSTTVQSVTIPENFTLTENFTLAENVTLKLGENVANETKPKLAMRSFNVNKHNKQRHVNKDRNVVNKTVKNKVNIKPDGGGNDGKIYTYLSENEDTLLNNFNKILQKNAKKDSDESDVKRYEVHEVEPNETVFSPIKTSKVKTEPLRQPNENANQAHLAPVYNYEAKNAYYVPYNRLGPNYEDEEENFKPIGRTFVKVDYNDNKTEEENLVGRSKYTNVTKTSGELELDYYFGRTVNSKDSHDDGIKTEDLNDNLNKKAKLSENRIKITQNRMHTKGSYVFKPNNEKYENQNNENDLDIYEYAIRKMIKEDNKALVNYDWLGTTVDLQSALKKLMHLLDLEDSDYIHPHDRQLLQYTRALYVNARNQYIDEKRHLLETDVVKKLDALRRFLLPRNNRMKGKIKDPIGLMKRVSAKLLRYLEVLSDDYFEDNYRPDQIILHSSDRDNLDFQNFVLNWENSLKNLHDGLRHIATVTEYRSQNWFQYLKNIFFTRKNRNSFLAALVHVFSARILDLIEASARRGATEDFVLYVKTHEEEFLKTTDAVAFVLALLDKINNI